MVPPAQRAPVRAPILEGPHALTVDAACEALATRPSGLPGAEAAARLEQHGANVLPTAEAPGLVQVFLRQFLSPLVYILLAAAAVSAGMRDWSDAGFILGVLLINAVIGCGQEFSAERSAQALRALTSPRALALRDGLEREVDAATLVPGDVVVLEAGIRVPADLLLCSPGGLEVDESLLTGESAPVTKRAGDALPPQTPLAERVNQAFAGTLVNRGRVHGLVVGTGVETQLGRIAASVAAGRSARPPLLVRMERFTRRVAIGVGIAVLALGGVALARGADSVQVFLLAVALAVSAIPEGLPVALTVALAIGARRMGRRRVIARRLVAVEALGSCTCVASDKTGTLTLNELSVAKVVLPDGTECEVTGPPLGPDGEVHASPERAAQVLGLAEAGALCNDAFLGEREAEGWVHHGDAVDVALLALAHKVGLSRARLEVELPRRAALPFEPERRYAATLHERASGPWAVVKGAPERVLPMCARVAVPGGDAPMDTAAVEAQAEALAQAGFRLLAVAAGPTPARPGREVLDDGASPPLAHLVFLGLVALTDPLRPEVRASVDACRAAGIQVVMVTGDHPITALAIARELGMANTPEQVVTGLALERVSAQGEVALDALVREARVFARVEPSQKLLVVQALMRQGHFVAVTGDGANDAPALRAAHIGVAMGGRGTDVARESAELILTDDNFASIVAGVEEGRVAYANVRKVVFLLVSTGLAEVLLFVLATATALPLPLWPVQLLWLNLVTNGIQDVALAFEPAEGGELSRPPRPPSEPIFDRLMVERTFVAAAVMAALAFAAYRWMLAEGWTVAAAQNGVLLTLVLFENVQAGASRSETGSLLALSPLRNRLLLVGTVLAQVIHIAALYTPGVRELLRLEPVSLGQWLATLGLAMVLFAAGEAHKVLLRRRGARHPPVALAENAPRP